MGGTSPSVLLSVCIDILQLAAHKAKRAKVPVCLNIVSMEEMCGGVELLQILHQILSQKLKLQVFMKTVPYSGNTLCSGLEVNDDIDSLLNTCYSSQIHFWEI